ncbi:ABC transporter ATP-binding protein [Pseudonocardia acaciae]|uniref:ABC transporter ATP-binding protein n=1 Tax=Pseudonocardia acaciae TaxID=551276 RepID=UPI000491A8FA|nr:ABC transporter ATP-binding protein [Pseudonocardia acaciae]
MTALLEARDLTITVPGPHGPVTVVDRVTFAIEEGQVFGLAGESGSGKTMTALAVPRLLPPRSVIEGEIRFRGRDLVRMPGKRLGAVRGREIGMVFQDPNTSLHPMLPVGAILTAPLRRHFGMGRSAARQRAAEALDEVRIPDPEGSLARYPHQFSGGMRQRIAIASALICRPGLLIADEPTTALDVTVQAGVLRLLDRLRRESGLGVLMITHDLGVMSSIAEVLTIMYGGRIVESGPARTVIRRPRHPYTEGLLAALPATGGRRGGLTPIPGGPPMPTAGRVGCGFAPRCTHAVDSCRTETPELVAVGDGRVACPVRLDRTDREA